MTTKHITTTGLLLGSILALSACDSAGSERRPEVAYEVTGAVAALLVDIDAGDVEVIGSDRSGIRVTETLHWRGGGTGPRAEHPVSGNTLNLRYTCDDKQANCAVDYRVEVPQDLRVKLDTGAGDLTVRSLAGTLSAVTGAGDVQGDGLTGTEADVHGVGSVELSFAAAPQRVDVRSVAGDVKLRLFGGPYRVTVNDAAGAQTVDVPIDPASTRTVTVDAGAGDIQLVKA